MRSIVCLARRSDPAPMTYRVTDRLHTRHTAHVAADGINSTVSGWLAELGVHSPLVADLARTVRDGEWAAAYAIADCLSIDVTVAP